MGRAQGYESLVGVQSDVQRVRKRKCVGHTEAFDRHDSAPGIGCKYRAKHNPISCGNQLLLAYDLSCVRRRLYTYGMAYERFPYCSSYHLIDEPRALDFH